MELTWILGNLDLVRNEKSTEERSICNGSSGQYGSSNIHLTRLKLDETSACYEILNLMATGIYLDLVKFLNRWPAIDTWVILRKLWL